MADKDNKDSGQVKFVPAPKVTGSGLSASQIATAVAQGARGTDSESAGEWAVIGGGNDQSPYHVKAATNSTSAVANPRGVLSKYPGVTPNYVDSLNISAEAASDLTVARIYLSGLTGKHPVTNRASNSAASALGRENLKELFSKGYVGFFLNQVTESHTERSETIPLSGGNFQTYFFGAAPPVYVFDGMFLNTRQDQWRLLWQILYQDVLRGTQVAAHRHLVQIAYDTKIVSGYLTGYTDQLRAGNELFSTFQFNMIVKSVDHTLTTGDILNTSNPFVGDITDFNDYADIRTGNLAEVRDYADTAYISPPRKPKPSGRRSTRAACRSPEVRTPGNADSTASTPYSDGVIARQCKYVNDGKRLEADRAKARKDQAFLARQKNVKLDKRTGIAKGKTIHDLDNAIKAANDREEDANNGLKSLSKQKNRDDYAAKLNAKTDDVLGAGNAESLAAANKAGRTPRVVASEPTEADIAHHKTQVIQGSGSDSKAEASYHSEQAEKARARAKKVRDAATDLQNEHRALGQSVRTDPSTRAAYGNAQAALEQAAKRHAAVAAAHQNKANSTGGY